MHIQMTVSRLELCLVYGCDPSTNIILWHNGGFFPAYRPGDMLDDFRFSVLLQSSTKRPEIVIVKNIDDLLELCADCPAGQIKDIRVW